MPLYRWDILQWDILHYILKIRRMIKVRYPCKKQAWCIMKSIVKYEYIIIRIIWTRLNLMNSLSISFHILLLLTLINFNNNYIINFIIITRYFLIVTMFTCFKKSFKNFITAFSQQSSTCEYPSASRTSTPRVLYKK